MLNIKVFLIFYNLAHQSKFLDWLIIFFAQYFPYFVILVSIIFLIFHHEIFLKEKPIKEIIQKLKEIFFVSCSVFLAWIFSIFLKIIFVVPRPFLILPNIQPIFLPNGFSFPSGHATFFMALAIAVFSYHRTIGWLFIISALLIGLARIMAGIHYPLDILVGYLLGGLISCLLINLSQKHKS